MTEPQIRKLIARRSFCMLASTSADGRAHVAGVLYAADGTTLYVSTLRTSKKARNIAASPDVSVCIPVRRLPVGPPSNLQFAARAEVLATDDPEIRRLAADGKLKAITGHGELDLPDGCFLRITPARRITTYGLGMPLRRLLKDPLHAGGAVALEG
jgi:general stress protein 26